MRLGLEAVAEERLRVDDVPGASGDLARHRLSRRSDREVLAGMAGETPGGERETEAVADFGRIDRLQPVGGGREREPASRGAVNDVKV